jgi:uncharacterized membrane protein YfcA
LRRAHNRRIDSGGDFAVPLLLIATLSLTMLGTAFLSGIFGMAGGMILIGVLLALLPLPEAMVLHGVTQMASNGWRAALWIRYVRWGSVAPYVLGGLAALGLWSLSRYVPSKPAAMLLLGVTPFLARLMPKSVRPNPESMVQGMIYGLICVGLILLTGVSGPLIDTFFLGGKAFDRKEIVATKAICQVFGHLAKLVYFGGLIEQTASLDWRMAVLAVAMSMLGATLAARVLAKMTDTQFRVWANRVITTIAGYYVLQGGYLLLAAKTGFALGF